MKKRIMLCLLAASCVLALPACSKTQTESTDASQQVSEAIVEPSNIAPAATKNYTVSVSRPEKLNPLTLEQVKTIISDSKTDKNTEKSRITYISMELDQIQKGQRVEIEETEIALNPDLDTVPRTERIYYLFDENGETNDVVVITTPYMHVDIETTNEQMAQAIVVYRHCDDNGEILSEEILYNFYYDDLPNMGYNYITLEQVQEIITASETQAVEQKRTSQAQWIWEELNKIQESSSYYVYFHSLDQKEKPCPVKSYFLKPTTNDKYESIVMRDTTIIHGGLDEKMAGGTLIFKVEQNVYGQVTHYEQIYQRTQKAHLEQVIEQCEQSGDVSGAEYYQQKLKECKEQRGWDYYEVSI